MLRAVAGDDDQVAESLAESLAARTVEDACARARRAQEAFASTPLRARAGLLRQLRRALLRRAEELIEVVMDESGKVRFEAITLEIAPAALALSYAASEGPAALADERMQAFVPLLRRATRRFDARGVVGLISPFNYTLSIPMSTLAPALVAGNAVVWKPAETGTRAAHTLVRILEDAGMPRDLVTVVEGGPAVGRALVDAPIDQLTFVGSTAAGREVAARCGERLLPCVLELGGSAPAIVLEDADLDRASRAIVYGGLANAGQSCVGFERVLCVPGAFDELLERTAALASRVRPGVDVARVDQRQARRVAELTADARARGARFLGEHVIDVTGCPDARVLDDEIFGPLIPFLRVRDADDAIRLANAHPQQLTASVFTRDAARGRALARRLRAPHVVVNDAMVSYAMMELPFGGEGGSGFGRVHGRDGIRALAREQIVVDGHLPLVKEPWWLPYDERVGELILRGAERALSLWERRPFRGGARRGKRGSR